MEDGLHRAVWVSSRFLVLSFLVLVGSLLYPFSKSFRAVVFFCGILVLGLEFFVHSMARSTWVRAPKTIEKVLMSGSALMFILMIVNSYIAIEKFFSGFFFFLGAPFIILYFSAILENR